MSREELEAKTTTESAAMCKLEGIQVSNHTRKFKKAELVESLLEKRKEERPPISVEPVKVSEPVEDKAEEAFAKQRYIETAEVGSLVAFKVPSKEDKVDSAKILHRSSKRAVLEVENKQGERYVVPYENILWVRTGLRWPKGVYELLTKGRRKNETEVKPSK